MNYMLQKKSRYIQERRLAYFLISPALLYLLATMLIPLLWAFGISFTDKMVGSTPHFIGLGNYIEVIKDNVFWRAVINTIVFTIFAVGFKVVLGTILALVLNEPIRGRNIYRALLLIPWTISNVVAVLTWQWLYSDVGGVLNYILMSLNLIDKPVGWLAGPSIAMFSIVLVNVWKGMPFLALTILSGLQTISEDLYEAAKIDGANTIQRFFNITLPGIKNVLIIGTLVTTIWTLNNFESVWLLTGGGPLNSTQIFSTLSYSYAFQSLNIGKGITVSIIVFPFILMLVQAATKQTLQSE